MPVVLNAAVVYADDPIHVLADDPIHVLNERYMTESRQVATKDTPPKVREAFYASWLEKFLAAQQEHTQSPLRIIALERATELANSLGRFNLSLDLLEQRLRLANGVSAELTLLYQKIEVASLAYFATGDASYAKKSIESFSKFEDLLASEPAYSGNHGAQWVLALMRSARLTCEALRKHGEAADLYMRAHEMIQRLAPKERVRLESWPDQESTLAGSAVEYAHAGRSSKAREVLSSLAELKDRKQPLGLHILSVLSATESPDAQLVDFVESWYRASGQREQFAPHVLLAVGQRLMKGENPGTRLEAANWLMRLIADHEAVLIVNPEKKGIVVEALRSLAITYDSLGRSEDASAARERLRAVISQTPSTTNTAPEETPSD